MLHLGFRLGPDLSKCVNSRQGFVSLMRNLSCTRSTSFKMASTSFERSPAVLNKFKFSLENRLNYHQTKEDLAQIAHAFYNQLPTNLIYEQFFESLIGVDGLFADLDDLNQKAQSKLLKKTLIRSFADFVVDKRSDASVKKVENELVAKLGNVKKVMQTMFELDCVQEFKAILFVDSLRTTVIDVLLDQLNDHMGKVLRWLQVIPVRDSFNYNTITAWCILRKESTDLYGLCRVDESVRNEVVYYLNWMAKCMPNENAVYDLDGDEDDEELGSAELNREILNKCMNTPVRMAFRMFKEFRMERSAIEHCIFHRQIQALAYVYNELDVESSNANQAAFEQAAIRSLHNPPRTQTVVLNFLDKKLSEQRVMVIARMAEVPLANWPHRLQLAYREKKDSVERNVIRRHEFLTKESETISRGVLILQPDHRAFILSSRDQLLAELPVFMRECPLEEHIGFDAEWDPSDCGLPGQLCLMQLSNSTRTVLIDVFVLRHVLGEHEWSGVFQLVFGSGKKVVGFDVNSDLTVLEHNFPFLTQTAQLRKALVCLKHATTTINIDEELRQIVFRNDEPVNKNNLASLASAVLGSCLSKTEQSSTWSYRPLRLKQVKYAGIDSLSVFHIYQRMTAAFKEAAMADVIGMIFRPLDELPKYNKDEELHIESNGGERRMKANKYTTEELFAIVDKCNAYFAARKRTNLLTPDQVVYAADTMCAQLGHWLRRLGVSTYPVDALQDQTDDFRRNVRVITSGKGRKKFAGMATVDVPSSSEPLDYQLEYLLKRERLCVARARVRERCAHCNERRFAWLPTAHAAWLHYDLLMRRQRPGPDEEDVYKVLEEMRDPYPLAAFVCCLLRPRRGPCLMTGQYAPAWIDVAKQQIAPLIPTGSSFKFGKFVDLKLQTHVNMAELKVPPYTLHSVCVECGRENLDYQINPVMDALKKTHKQ